MKAQLVPDEVEPEQTVALLGMYGGVAHGFGWHDELVIQLPSKQVTLSEPV